MSLFDEIRSRAREVAGQARWVRIEDDRVADYARSLPVCAIAQPEIFPMEGILGDEERTAGFLVALNAVNFGSGYFPAIAKISGKSGFMTVATRLNKAVLEGFSLQPDHLAGLVAEDCRKVFGQRPENADAMELMDLFARAWNDLGRTLVDEYGASVRRLIESANQSAEDLVRRLADMAFFRDVSDYRGVEVPFYKRAQITAADLALALDGTGLGCFTDLGELTIFADNLVPHVLRLDGLLVFEDSLVQRIERGEPLGSQAEEEVEIRACALHAVELVTAELRRLGVPGATAHRVDYLLWNRGQGAAYKARPRHRCRCVYY